MITKQKRRVITMDKFMETLQKMEKMSPDEKKQMLTKAREMCICAGCPSYTTCMKEKDELLFCANGKSMCTVEERGCICPTCPVTSMLGLTHMYYCIKGTEQEQRGM